MVDDALGHNPLEQEMDSIWKVPKKDISADAPTPPLASSAVFTPSPAPSVPADSVPPAEAMPVAKSGDSWLPLEPVAATAFSVPYDGNPLDAMAEEVDEEKVQEVETVQLVGFRLGNELFGINIMNIQEIIRNLEITRVPRTMPFVLGVVNLRGKVIPVISLKEKFGFHEDSSGSKSRVIIISTAMGLIGFEVSEVTEVLCVPLDIIVPPPPSSSRLDSEYISGVGRLDEQLIVILNLEHLVSSSKMTLDIIN